LREAREHEEENPMTEQRVSEKTLEVSKTGKQATADHTVLTLRDAVAVRGMSLKVHTHLRAGATREIKW
jgi:hypothetical protein